MGAFPEWRLLSWVGSPQVQWPELRLVSSHSHTLRPGCALFHNGTEQKPRSRRGLAQGEAQGWCQRSGRKSGPRLPSPGWQLSWPSGWCVLPGLPERKEGNGISLVPSKFPAHHFFSQHDAGAPALGITQGGGGGGRTRKLLLAQRRSL